MSKYGRLTVITLLFLIGTGGPGEGPDDSGLHRPHPQVHQDIRLQFHLGEVPGTWGHKVDKQPAFRQFPSVYTVFIIVFTHIDAYKAPAFSTVLWIILVNSDPDPDQHPRPADSDSFHPNF